MHQAAAGRSRAPEYNPGKQQIAPVATVRNAGEWQRKDNVEHRKRSPLQQPDRRVVDAELALDGVNQDRDDRPVEVVEREREEQDKADVPCIASCT